VRGRLTEEQTQLALLNRLSVMGSKGLGDECLEDALAFAHLADKSDARKLTPQMRSVAVAAVQQRYFLLNVVLDGGAFLRKARSLATSATGREVLRAFAEDLLAWLGGEPSRCGTSPSARTRARSMGQQQAARSSTVRAPGDTTVVVRQVRGLPRG